MTVGELYDRMTYVELSEWIALESIQPLPDPWVIGARIAAGVASLFASKPVKIRDFLPEFLRSSPQGRAPQRPGDARAIAIETLGALGVFKPSAKRGQTTPGTADVRND